MNNFLCYLLLCLLTSSGLSSCMSVDKVLFQPHSAALDNRLPALEIAVDNGPLMNSDGSLPEDPFRLFEREVSHNLVDPTDSTKFGYLKLTVISAVSARQGKGLQAFQMATLMVPSLFGVPIEYYRTKLRAQVQVISSRGEVLGSFSGSGTSTVNVAMYHGYSQTDAGRLADITALRYALNMIRPQLELASESLRAKLIASGPIEPLPSATASQR